MLDTFIHVAPDSPRKIAIAQRASASVSPRSLRVFTCMRHQRDDQLCLIYLHVVSLVARLHACA